VAILDERGAWLSFLDFGLLQKADNRQAAQRSSNKLYNYVIISLAD
jgi:hypothetical protein